MYIKATTINRMVMVIGMMCLLLAGCGGGGGGGGSIPVIPDTPVITETTISNNDVLYWWSIDVGGTNIIDAYKTIYQKGLGNTAMPKKRDYDTGQDGNITANVVECGLKVVYNAQDGDINAAAVGAKGVQDQFGDNLRMVIIALDEMDLMPGTYSPEYIDGIAGVFRAAGVTAPLAINFSGAVGLGTVGHEYIKSLPAGQRLPKTLQYLILEYYHITPERWEQTMGPAMLEFLGWMDEECPAARPSILQAAWSDYNQPVPSYDMVYSIYKSFTTQAPYTDYAHRLGPWGCYRWSNDPGAGDCAVAGEDYAIAPGIQDAIRDICTKEGWN